MKKRFTFLMAAVFSLTMASAETVPPATSLTFDNLNSIDCGTNSAFTDLDAFTIEAWVNWDDLAPNAYIASTEMRDGEFRAGWVLKAESSKFYLKTGNGTGWNQVAAATTIPQINTWYHVAATYTTTEMKLYINGVEEGVASIGSPMQYSTANMAIGGGVSMYNNRFMKGRLADVRLWNVVRTPAEIAAKMAPGSLAGTEAGLVANWKMNEGTGDNLSELTGKYPLTFDSSILIWSTSGNAVSNNTLTDALQAIVRGKSLKLTNNSASEIAVSVYTVAGVKVSAFQVKAGETFTNDFNLTGVYFLKAVATNGDGINTKVLFN